MMFIFSTTLYMSWSICCSKLVVFQTDSCFAVPVLCHKGRYPAFKQRNSSVICLDTCL